MAGEFSLALDSKNIQLKIKWKSSKKLKIRIPVRLDLLISLELCSQLCSKFQSKNISRRKHLRKDKKKKFLKIAKKNFISAQGTILRSLTFPRLSKDKAILHGANMQSSISIFDSSVEKNYLHCATVQC